jgi:GxxExxY protein
MRHADVAPELANVVETVMDAAIDVHRALGPGLREPHYHDCLEAELLLAGLEVESRVDVDLLYKGRALRSAAQFDLVVQRKLLIEIKAVEALHPHHFMQARSYVRFGRFPLGILVNFHAPRLVDGWHRILPGTIPEHAAVAAAPRRRMRSRSERTAAGQEETL